MAATRAFRFALPFLCATRRIDGVELRIERARARGRDFVDRANSAQCTDGCAKQSHAGQKEQGFFLGRSRHAGRLQPGLGSAGINSFRYEANLTSSIAHHPP